MFHINLANKITVARISLIPLFILLYYAYPAHLSQDYSLFHYLEKSGAAWAVIIFIIASITDRLDGYVARKYNQVTNLGKLLDPLADKLLVATAMILLVQHGILSSAFVIIIIIREFVITALRTYAASCGIALQADHWGKYKLVLQVVAITLCLLENYPFSLFTSVPVHLISMLAAVILTVYSGVNYIMNNIKLLQ